MSDVQDGGTGGPQRSSFVPKLSWTFSCLCMLGLTALGLGFGPGERRAEPSQAAPADEPEPVRATPVVDTCLVNDGGSASSATARLVDLIAARYRHVAEREGASRLRLPAGFDRINRQAARVAANEQRILDARKAAFDSQQRAFRLRIQNVEEEMEAFEKQKRAKEEEIALIRRELQIVETMHARQLANVPRLLNLKREVTRGQWDIGSIEAALARSRLAIKEIEQDMHSNKHDVVVDAAREIRKLDMDIDALAGEQCAEIPGALKKDRAREMVRHQSEKPEAEGPRLHKIRE